MVGTVNALALLYRISARRHKWAMHTKFLAKTKGFLMKPIYGMVGSGFYTVTLARKADAVMCDV